MYEVVPILVPILFLISYEKHGNLLDLGTAVSV
jgi:hypothetical protein